MSQHLKYSAIILICVTVLVILFRFGSCNDAKMDDVTIRIPTDSGFVPVTERKYRPPSTPFERSSKSPVKFPKDLSEGNVARIVTVVKRIPIDSAHSLWDTTSVIVTKGDQVFVPKQPGTQTTVQDTKFTDPIFRWGLFSSVGISIAKFGVPTLEVSPSLAIAPLEIMGEVRFPFLTTDLTGVGIGIAYRHNDFIFALANHERFIDAGRSIRIMIHYSI